MSDYRGIRGFGRFSIFPPVLKTLLIINIVVYAVQYLFLEYYTIGGVSLNDYFLHYFALQPVVGVPSSYSGDFYPWQLLTYQFMHSPGTFPLFSMHLFFNMFALWMFGSELENLWGSRRFLFYYLLCGIGAGLVHLFISPLFSPPALTIGASGAIYGLLLSFGLTFPNRPIFIFPFFIPIPAKFFVLIFGVIELYSGFSGYDGIAHFAHLGGAATGFLLLKFGDSLGIYNFLDKIFKPRLKADYGYSDMYGKPREKARVYDFFSSKPVDVKSEKKSRTAASLNIDDEEITQEKIDEILDKISETGYQNLTDREKKILFELSKKIK